MSQNEFLSALEERLAPLREQLLHHPIYRQLDSLEALRGFMQKHVFAVWDFMSLLKALQQRVCCVNVPWLPSAAPAAARFINEIVLGEESDINAEGEAASHFDLYYQAMQRCGASTEQIDRFLHVVRTGQTIPRALSAAEVSPGVAQFVQQTFAFIETNDAAVIAAAFTFGREDLLPEVFQRVVDELNQHSGGDLEPFRYYLQRHIELDGDQHGPLSQRLVATLCGDDPRRWSVASDAAFQALESRLILWNDMLSTHHEHTHETLAT
jgi:hypothetical protein